MKTIFQLLSGKCEANDNLDGFVIVTELAIAEGNDDLPLIKGDRITIHGDVYRGDTLLGNIS